MKKKSKSKLSIIRFIVQATVLIGVFLVGLNKSFDGKLLPFLPSASTHAICPFGGAETAYTLAASGTYVSKIHSSSVILFILVLIITLLFGAIFCGFICPFGSVQEWIGKLGKKLFPTKHNQWLPKKIDAALRFLRYLVLGKILWDTASAGKLIFEKADPYYALMNFFSNEIAPSALIFLGITILLSLFITRPFCKYICPFGAILGLVGKLSLFKPRRNPETCIQCKKCDNSCPMNISISSKINVSGHHCISCYRCVSGEACPVKETVEIGIRKLDAGVK